MTWLEELHHDAAARGCSVGIRLISFHADDRTGYTRTSLMGSLEVRHLDGAGRFRDRELVAGARLAGPVKAPARSVEDAAKYLVGLLRSRQNWRA